MSTTQKHEQTHNKWKGEIDYTDLSCNYSYINMYQPNMTKRNLEKLKHLW